MSGSASRSDPDYHTRRERMVEQQIANRGVNDPRVLAAMHTVPRHEFVPERLRAEAYADHPLPIGHNQTISQPFVVASMTELLEPTPDSRILEIGTGCGYQTAVLAEIVRHVYTIEVVPELAAEAHTRLIQLGYKNVSTRQGDGSQGWLEEAPFDGILVAAAAYVVPPALIDQLSDGGHMVLPLVSEDGYHQNLTLLTKSGGEITRQTLYGVRFVPLL